MKFAGALRAVREHEAGDGEGDAGDDGSGDGLSEHEGRGGAGERGHEVDVGARGDGAEVLHGEVPGGEAGS